MIRTALPLYQQILIDVVLPPVATAILLLIPAGRLGILGISNRPPAKVWSSSKFWIFLAMLYAIMFSVTIYGRYT